MEMSLRANDLEMSWTKCGWQNAVDLNSTKREVRKLRATIGVYGFIQGFLKSDGVEASSELGSSYPCTPALTTGVLSQKTSVWLI